MIVSESQHSYTAVVSGTYPDPHTTIKQAVGGGTPPQTPPDRAGGPRCEQVVHTRG